MKALSAGGSSARPVLLGDVFMERAGSNPRRAPRATAVRLLTEHRGKLGTLAQALLARETLDEQDILAVTGLPPAPALDGSPAHEENGRVAEVASSR